MKGFNGRANTYRQAMADDAPEALEEALKRNLYGSLETPPEGAAQRMAAYMYDSTALLGEQKWEQLSSGQIGFEDMRKDAKLKGEG